MDAKSVGALSCAWGSEMGSCGGVEDVHGDLSFVHPGSRSPCGAGALEAFLQAMTAMGLEDAEKNDVLRVLSAVLHLGQVGEEDS